MKEVSRELGAPEQTYYRRRKEYGGLKVSQARRLKELERENAQLNKAVAELTLDKQLSWIQTAGARSHLPNVHSLEYAGNDIMSEGIPYKEDSNLKSGASIGGRSE